MSLWGVYGALILFASFLTGRASKGSALASSAESAM